MCIWGRLRKVRIDKKDLLILKILYKNARALLSDLANATNISITAVRNRVLKLLKHKIILGFHADIDFSKIGYNVHAFTGIKIEPKFREKIISNLIHNWRVLKLHEVTGEFDLIVELIAKDLTDLREFLTTEMYSIPGIKKTYTMVILKTFQGNNVIGFQEDLKANESLYKIISKYKVISKYQL